MYFTDSRINLSNTTSSISDSRLTYRHDLPVLYLPRFFISGAYFENPAYIEALAASVRETYDKLETKPDQLVVSYHGVPERYLLNGDSYHCHCQKSTRLLAQALGMSDGHIITAFQSKFGPEKWVGPATVEEVARLAANGKKNIAIIAPAFSADCVETLEEINEEIRESFEDAGGEAFTYIPCLNDRDDHIAALLGIIENELQGWV